VATVIATQPAIMGPRLFCARAMSVLQLALADALWRNIAFRFDLRRFGLVRTSSRTCRARPGMIRSPGVWPSDRQAHAHEVLNEYGVLIPSAGAH